MVGLCILVFVGGSVVVFGVDVWCVFVVYFFEFSWIVVEWGGCEMWFGMLIVFVVSCSVDLFVSVVYVVYGLVVVFVVIVMIFLWVKCVRFEFCVMVFVVVMLLM